MHRPDEKERKQIGIACRHLATSLRSSVMTSIPEGHKLSKINLHHDNHFYDDSGM